MKHNKFEKILSIAANLMSERGYYATSFQEIANNVGLHKSTLFHYFKNKKELFVQILEKSIEEVYINLEKICTNEELEPEEKLRMAINNHFTQLVKNFSEVNVYLNEFRNLPKENQKEYLKKRKKYERDLGKIIAEMKLKGHFNGLDTKIITLGILGMVNWVPKWFKNDGSLSINEISNIFYRMLVKKSN